MTSMERVLTALGHQEPDRVPLSLLLTIHGARELGLSIREYFSRPEYVVEGQLRMREKYRHDCVNSFCAAAMTVEAFGGEVLWFDDGSPNSGEPIIKTEQDILSLQVPEISSTPCLVRMLKTIEMLKEQVGDEVPIMGIAVSPFSLPVMQMGFPAYIELMHGQPILFNRLMKVNQEFCVAWANAQVQAGATAVCYFDALLSPTITASAHLEIGFRIARDTLARINSPSAIHMATAATLSVIEEVIATGTSMIGVSILDDLAALKAVCRGRLTILGNLNGVEMRRWTSEQAEKNVKEVIEQGAPGGGFILADNGEIPWQVSEEVLLSVSDAVHKWGRYPGCCRTGQGEEV
ncbi:uroporphyrinogen decarboxylase family protein [Desulfobulbus sp. US4]|nr:uroporphyrinogen decarboxylase family protein [Desulfobulbus sp. US4]